MKRALRRAAVGATAFFAASAIAAPAAFAETTADLEVAFKGTTLSAGSPQKVALFTVKNNGPQAATDVTFDLDLSGLDDAKVEWETDGIGCDDPNPADELLLNCVLNPLDPGTTTDFFFLLNRKGSATGAAGSMKVTVKAPQDENAANNSATTNVVLSDVSGVDLTAWAWDISEEELPTGNPVKPGATAFFYGVVANYGTVASSRLNMEIKLPEGVTFVGNEPDCDYNTGSTSTVCTYTGRAGQVAPQTGERFFFEVKVSETVAGPVTLGGGVFTVIDVPQAPSAPSANRTGTEPRNVTPFDINDVDESDNVDEFNALVAKGDGQGGLPTTGVKVALLAGVGAGVLAIGAVLFVLTRRRRMTA